MEAADPAQAQGHVRIAAEVEVDLQRVAQRREPGSLHRQCFAAREERVGDAGERIGEQHLLRQPETEQHVAVVQMPRTDHAPA